MNNVIQTIIAIPVFLLILFLAFTYLPALLAKTTKTAMRTRGVINTTYRPGDVDIIHAGVKETAKKLYKNAILDEYKKTVFEINDLLTKKSSYQYRYSDYIELSQKLLLLASVKNKARSKTSGPEYMPDGRLKAKIVMGRQPSSFAIPDGVPEMYLISRTLNALDNLMQGISVDTIIGFFSKIITIETIEEKKTFLDSIYLENFRPLETIIISIYQRFRHRELDEAQIDQLRHYIMSKYINYKR